jgi:hypothetical protein
MNKKINNLLAIFFPWVILFLNDNLGGALLCLAMQASIVGWIPASYWAWKIVHTKEKKPAPQPTAQQPPKE